MNRLLSTWLRPVCCSALLMGAFFSSQSHADWQLSQPSEVTFVSAKNTHLLEVHRFSNINGHVSDDGQARIEIDLSSIDSRIPVRDERMQKHLFEVAQFAKASISATIPADVMAQVKAGKVSRVQQAAVLNLHGSDEPLELQLLVAPAASGDVVITSLQPVLVHADDFGLTKGIRLLQDIAKLQVIAEVVPVSFSLTFSPE
jgi:polyisoprenoid-binding protein YceI